MTDIAINTTAIEINDKRAAADFRGVSFSKFQKSKVKSELLSSLINNKLEPACYWVAELVCAGHFLDVWDIIILFVSRYIHLGNPKLPIYIAMRFNNFKEIISNGYAGNELSLRNSVKVRQLFSEIICILAQSRKKHSFETVKILKADEFDMTHMASKLKAPSITYAAAVFKSDDPKELYIAMNEFAYHLSKDSRNGVMACYWLEWFLEFEARCKQNKEECLAETRTFAAVADKFMKDPIWLIWELLLQGAATDPLVKKIMTALLDIFCIKYTSGSKKKRRFIIYFAVNLLTETVDFKIDIMGNKAQIDSIMKKIGLVYKDVKKNEVTLGDDYLFMGVERSNLDKTIERLEKMNELMH
jgi:hypothetical protein